MLLHLTSGLGVFVPPLALEKRSLGSRKKMHSFSRTSNSTSGTFGSWDRMLCKLFTPPRRSGTFFPNEAFSDEHNSDPSVCLQLRCLSVNNRNNNNEHFIQQGSGSTLTL